ncbi:MAG: NADH:flavin oxidoreductase [Candidatus Viridilinea halotolerans]|uniref:NADH:flavin oxidoreductase n=1 Tax=Candidatus Viridilinea halotolerans TaxID=2491704 RepID=A0A426UAV1_9CHLR|nr:MAG: NADH:flavin oxidoreductase [Candidatus Viridilinea halotolerans]
MADLFSSLKIGSRTLRNRIVMAPLPSGTAVRDGFVTDATIDYYARLAQGGVGLILTEALWVVQPSSAQPHLGLYSDLFVPRLRQLVTIARIQGARVLLTLDAPIPDSALTTAALHNLGETFIMAMARAQRTGADGVLLSAADGGVLHQLLSPLSNQRVDHYGTPSGRSRLMLEILEGARAWLGRRIIIGVRLLPDEFTPGGLNAQDARMLARRLSAAGMQLLDLAPPSEQLHVARFPGWAIPLAHTIRRVLDVPVIGSGELDDPYLADSVIRDGMIDLVMLDEALQHDPDWPLRARRVLEDP